MECWARYLPYTASETSSIPASLISSLVLPSQLPFGWMKFTVSLTHAGMLATARSFAPMSLTNHQLTCIVFSDAHARDFDAFACIPPIAHQSKSARTLKDPRALCIVCDMKCITARCGRTSQAVRRQRRRRGNCNTWRPLPCARAVLQAFWPQSLHP